MRIPARRVPRLLVGIAVAAAVGAGCSSGGSDGAGPKLSPLGEQGQQVASDSGCVACHTSNGGSSTGPTWKGLAGSKVTVDGKSIVASDAYLKRAITDPHAEVVDGYADIMPTYAGRLSATEVSQLVAYLRDLSSKTNPPAAD